MYNPASFFSSCCLFQGQEMDKSAELGEITSLKARIEELETENNRVGEVHWNNIWICTYLLDHSSSGPK